MGAQWLLLFRIFLCNLALGMYFSHPLQQGEELILKCLFWVTGIRNSLSCWVPPIPLEHKASFVLTTPLGFFWGGGRRPGLWQSGIPSALRHRRARLGAADRSATVRLSVCAEPPPSPDGPGAAAARRRRAAAPRWVKGSGIRTKRPAAKCPRAGALLGSPLAPRVPAAPVRAPAAGGSSQQGESLVSPENVSLMPHWRALKIPKTNLTPSLSQGEAMAVTATWNVALVLGVLCSPCPARSPPFPTRWAPWGQKAVHFCSVTSF